jgi:hypothetical protein
MTAFLNQAKAIFFTPPRPLLFSSPINPKPPYSPLDFAMEDDEASASPPLPWMQNKSAAAIEASSGPLSAVASRLSARSRALPSSRDFHFYINLPAFKSSVGAVAAKADASLGVLGGASILPMR